MRFYRYSNSVEATDTTPGQVLDKTNPPAVVIEYLDKAKIDPATVTGYKLTTTESRGLLSLIFRRASEKRTTVEFTTVDNGVKAQHLMIVTPPKP